MAGLRARLTPASIVFALWLLIKGVDTEKWRGKTGPANSL